MDFTDFIEQHAPGKSEAGRLLGKLVDAVRDTGKPGTLTFTVKIDVDKAQPNTGLLISDEVAAKLPKHERPVRKAWMLPSGQVVDYDPDAPPFEGLAVDEAGKLVTLTEEEVQAGAAHFLQHTEGVHLSIVKDDGEVVDAESLPADTNAEEEVPGDPEVDAYLPPDAPFLHEGEEEAPADFDPNNPFALASTAAPARAAGLTDPPEKKARAPRAPRKVKDQPQA